MENYESTPESVYQPSEVLVQTTASSAIGVLLRAELQDLWDPTLRHEERQKSLAKYEIAKIAMDHSVKLEQQSITDGLTGLYNKGSFHDQFDEILDFTWRNNNKFQGQNGLTLLFVDLNGFKPINDQVGHAAGDKVLKGIADRLRGATRKYDKVFRFGGDEFVIIIHGLEQKAIDKKSAELKEDIRQPFQLPEGVRVSVGAALGNTHLDAKLIESLSLLDPEERKARLEAMLHEADQQMYEDKLKSKARR